MQFLKKLWKILEDIEILNFSQQKEAETVIKTRLSYYKDFHGKATSKRNEKN